MRWPSLTLLLLLSSCAAPPVLTWNFVTAPGLREQAVRAGLFPADRVRAFALWRLGGCTIVSTEPASAAELVEIWAHERRHCAEGPFH